VFQCVGVCLHYSAVCCSVLAAPRLPRLKNVSVCCSVLQCVVVCCSVLQCAAVCFSVLVVQWLLVLQASAVWL